MDKGQDDKKRKGEMKGMISKKLSGIDIKEVLAYAVLTAFFFWWQKFFPELSFAYIEKVTLGVRVLYSIVLADFVISSVKKILELWGKKAGSEAAEIGKKESEETKDEVKRSEISTGEVTEETISSVPKGQISRFEKSVLVDRDSNLSYIGDFLFYASFALCFGLQLIASTRFPSIIHLFAGMQRLGVSLSCLMAIFLFNRKPTVDIKLLVLQIFILIADIGFLAVHGGIWLYPMMIFVVGAYGRRFLPVVHMALIESAFVMVATSYCSFSGLIEMVIKDGNKHGYGYAGPNEASMQYMFFLMMYFFARYYAEKKSESQQKNRGDAGVSCLKVVSVKGADPEYREEALDPILNPIGTNQAKSKDSGVKAARILNIVDALVLSFGLKFIVSYSSGRASIVCALTLTAGVVIYKLSKLYQVDAWPEIARNVIDKVFLLLFVPVFLYVAAFSFASSYFFNEEKPYGWIFKIGKIFNVGSLITRLRLGNLALLQYRPSIFGTFIRESLEDDTYFIIDNYYIKAYIQYGLIYFICILLIFSVINYAFWKRKEYFSLFLLSIVAGLGFLEAQIGEMQYDIFPLIVFACDVGCIALRRDGIYNKKPESKKISPYRDV
ncbi:MAG: hypothetical protein J6I76_07915 [Oribacterium sp.]|nr:hypothetical protein [Oribacterium sp.]